MTRNVNHISFILLIVSTALMISTCGKKEDSSPTKPPEVIYSGRWVGTTLQNKQISFNVDNNAVTSVTVSYVIQDGNFNFSRVGYYKLLGTPVSIAADTFSVTVTVPTSGLNVELFTVWGRFGSETSSSGKLSAVLFLYDASGGTYHSMSTDWSASKQ